MVEVQQVIHSWNSCVSRSTHESASRGRCGPRASPHARHPRQSSAEIVNQIGAALAARRDRILISHSQVGPVKWLCLFVQAVGLLLLVALVHCDNRLTVGIAIWIMATGMATCVLLIVAYDRPFVGQLAVGSEPLLEVLAAAAVP